MALYRFLFAPVLLAVAVAIGDGGEPREHAPPAAEVRAAPPAAAPAPLHGTPAERSAENARPDAR